MSRSRLAWDLVVAGAGGGLVGALRAAQLGATVLVIDADPHFRTANNTAMSTAMLPAAGTRWQRAQGIDDTPEQFLADITAQTNGAADECLATALVEASSRLVEWLADDAGLPLDLVTEFQYAGHGQLRCHSLPSRRGEVLVRRLAELASADEAIDLVAPARLADMEPRDGAEHAVTIAHPDGSIETIEANRVLLATGGFGASEELVRRHVPEIEGARYHGSSEAKGDALRIGTKLGAATGYLDAYQGHAALTVPHDTLAGWATVIHGAILVNLHGERFGDETIGYSAYARRVLAQPDGVAFLVLDRRIDELCRAFGDYAETVEAGALRWANGTKELAERCGLPPTAVEETIARARASASGAADEFGRLSWEAPLGSPLAGIQVGAALFHTQGGLSVDGHGRVLRPDGTAIRGLWASGGAAAGISGHGADGYLAGNGLLSALGLAFLAGEDAAAALGRA